MQVLNTNLIKFTFLLLLYFLTLGKQKKSTRKKMFFFIFETIIMKQNKPKKPKIYTIIKGERLVIL